MDRNKREKLKRQATAAAVATVARRFSPRTAAFVKLAGGAAILGGTVTAAVRGEKRREREREEAEIEAMEEPKPETMEEARRRVLRMADETAEFRF